MLVKSALPFSLSPAETINGCAVVLSKIRAVQAACVDGCLEAVKPLAHSVLVGAGLGVLGAALVACAIPILSCIPRLPQ